MPKDQHHGNEYSIALMYTNEVSPEFLRTLDKSPFTEQQLAEFSEEAIALIHQQQAYCEAHPPLAIYRLATEGSQTRDGGVIQHATTQTVITLGSGQQVTVAQVGDYVVYADGSTAKKAWGGEQYYGLETSLPLARNAVEPASSSTVCRP